MFGLNVRQLFLLFLLVLALLAGTQYFPAYFDAIQFNDFIRSEVKYAGSTRKTEAKLRSSIVEKAKEFNIALAARDVRIMRHGPAFTLELDYRMPIDLRVYKHDLVFHVSQSGELLE
jgi:hypothetical protein